jgi:hypothetical protein
MVSLYERNRHNEALDTIRKARLAQERIAHKSGAHTSKERYNASRGCPNCQRWVRLYDRR